MEGEMKVTQEGGSLVEVRRGGKDVVFETSAGGRYRLML
jgi:hypothetical protein